VIEIPSGNTLTVRDDLCYGGNMGAHKATFASQRWPLFFRKLLRALIGVSLLVWVPECSYKRQEIAGISGLDIQPEGKTALIVKGAPADQTLEVHGAGKLAEPG